MGLFGTAAATMGMLGTAVFILAMNNFGYVPTLFPLVKHPELTSVVCFHQTDR